MNPYIISVSRREDIPAFRSQWFIDRLKEGHVTLNNIFNGRDYDVHFNNTKVAVFWTKNPRPLMKHLKDIPFDYYFQYTLNHYPEYELKVPEIENRIATFIDLSQTIGKEKVIWRFDPIIINEKLSLDDIISRIEYIGNIIYTYTEKLVFSFVDPYKKLKDQFKEIPKNTKIEIGKRLIELNKKWNLKLATCAEGIDLEGIEHNKCVDPDLIEKICGKQDWLSTKKDKSQRLDCGCIASTDIGTFRTCRHDCTYCYAC